MGARPPPYGLKPSGPPQPHPTCAALISQRSVPHSPTPQVNGESGPAPRRVPTDESPGTAIVAIVAKVRFTSLLDHSSAKSAVRSNWPSFDVPLEAIVADLLAILSSRRNQIEMIGMGARPSFGRTATDPL